MGAGSRSDRNCFYCMFYVCGDSSSAENPFVYYFAIPGFLGWILPYFLYKKIVRNQTEKLTPMIEAKYDEIYEICEKGNKLLY